MPIMPSFTSPSTETHNIYINFAIWFRCFPLLFSRISVLYVCGFSISKINSLCMQPTCQVVSYYLFWLNMSMFISPSSQSLKGVRKGGTMCTRSLSDPLPSVTDDFWNFFFKIERKIVDIFEKSLTKITKSSFSLLGVIQTYNLIFRYVIWNDGHFFEFARVICGADGVLSWKSGWPPKWNRAHALVVFWLNIWLYLSAVVAVVVIVVIFCSTFDTSPYLTWMNYLT